MSSMLSAQEVATALPRALSSYPEQTGASLFEVLIERVRLEPFNAIATAIFALAILHTFAAIQFARRAHRVQHAHDERARLAGKPATPSVAAEVLHFIRTSPEYSPSEVALRTWLGPAGDVARRVENSLISIGRLIAQFVPAVADEVAGDVE